LAFAGNRIVVRLDYPWVTVRDVLLTLESNGPSKRGTRSTVAKTVHRDTVSDARLTGPLVS